MSTATRPVPPHGSEGRYQGTRLRPGCRCKTCIHGWNKAHQRRALARLEGRPPKVPAGPVTAHIAFLYAGDMTTGQIAHAAHVSPSTINDHANGRFPAIRRATAERILAVALEQPCVIGYVPALGTMRRLQTLYAAGHGSRQISTACPQLQQRNIEYIVAGTRSQVFVTIRDAAATAYRELSSRPGVSIAAKRRAKVEGWADPRYWDIDDFDNPDFTPALEVAIKAVDIVAENAGWLIESGLDRNAAAKRIGKSRFYIDRALREASATEPNKVAA